MKKSPRRNQLANVAEEAAKAVEKLPNKPTGNDPANPLRRSLMMAQSRSTVSNLKGGEEKNVKDDLSVGTKCWSMFTMALPT